MINSTIIKSEFTLLSDIHFCISMLMDYLAHSSIVLTIIVPYSTNY